MRQTITERNAVRQALDGALGTIGAVFPAKGEAPATPAKAAFRPSKKLSEALTFAMDKHGDQARTASEIPYVTHLLGVASLVGDSGGEEMEMIAAILHDTVEHCGGEPVLAEIRKKFGVTVAEIVQGCSDPRTSEEVQLPWLERKREYLKQLAQAPLPVLRVACADKLHNAWAIARDLRDLGPSVFHRFPGEKEGTLWYYRSLARIFGALVLDDPGLDPGFRAMIRELRETVAGMEG